jgi:hypothetical protein
MKKIKIFVSSTCYDLSQIRTDLHDYIEDCSYTPILSEYKSFPINPSKKTIDNCIDAVKNDADIFVLVVGNRYGTKIDSGSSITNTEFLTAKNKGIPIYIFIDKRMLNILPVWEKNKSGNFNEIVDSPKIFEFISEIRNDSQLWSFEFEKAQDIISILKIQLAYLFKESLEIKSRFNVEIEDLFKKNITNDALNILLKKERLYELDFFAQTLIDELKKKESIKNDYEYKILLESKFTVYNNYDLLSWGQQRLAVLRNLFESLTTLIQKAFPLYFGEPGIPSDLKGLYYISETYARVFENIIYWTIETSSTCVNDECLNLRNKLAKLSSKMIEQIWQYPFDLKKEIIRLRETNTEGEYKSILTIGFDEKDLEEYNKEFDNYKNLITK